MQDIVFATLCDSEKHISLLHESLRDFGGGLADRPLYVLCRDDDRFSGPPEFILPYQIDPQIAPQIAAFPFAQKIFAAAALEEHFKAQNVTLVWLDSDTLILQEPAAFRLADGVDFAYCSVHHRLIGAPFDAPLSAFWQAIFTACGVPNARLFPMHTVVDHAQIYPYFNAGHYALSSRTGLLNTWKARFLALVDTPEMRGWYEKHALYRVFFHQAVFTAVLLAGLAPERMAALPANYNYPLHLYDDDSPERRPRSTDNLVTCRYESLLFEKGGRDLPVIGTRLQEWLM